MLYAGADGMKFSDDDEFNSVAKGIVILMGLMFISMGMGEYFGAAVGFGLFGALMLLTGVFAK
jgi:hypothetical protein